MEKKRFKHAINGYCSKYSQNNARFGNLLDNIEVKILFGPRSRSVSRVILGNLFTCIFCLNCSTKQINFSSILIGGVWRGQKNSAHKMAAQMNNFREKKNNSLFFFFPVCFGYFSFCVFFHFFLFFFFQFFSFSSHFSRLFVFSVTLFLATGSRRGYVWLRFGSWRELRRGGLRVHVV